MYTLFFMFIRDVVRIRIERDIKVLIMYIIKYLSK